jgi:hypothetical protein
MVWFEAGVHLGPQSSWLGSRGVPLGLLGLGPPAVNFRVGLLVRADRLGLIAGGVDGGGVCEVPFLSPAPWVLDALRAFAALNRLSIPCGRREC